jgi:hypothetical protein
MKRIYEFESDALWIYVYDLRVRNAVVRYLGDDISLIFSVDFLLVI